MVLNGYEAQKHCAFNEIWEVNWRLRKGGRKKNLKMEFVNLRFKSISVLCFVFYVFGCCCYMSYCMFLIPFLAVLPVSTDIKK